LFSPHATGGAVGLCLKPSILASLYWLFPFLNDLKVPADACHLGERYASNFFNYFALCLTVLWMKITKLLTMFVGKKRNRIYFNVSCWLFFSFLKLMSCDGVLFSLVLLTVVVRLFLNKNWYFLARFP